MEIDSTIPNENSLSRLNETTSSSGERKTSKFQPGQSGNPQGRPKGTKNEITLLKQSLELRLRNKAKHQIEAVLEKAIELALEGDRMMIKLLLELHISKVQSQEDDKGGKSQVAVVIQNLTDAPVNQPISVKEIIHG